MCNDVRGNTAEHKAEHKARERNKEHAESAEDAAEEHSEVKGYEHLDHVGRQPVGKRGLGTFRTSFLHKEDTERKTRRREDNPVYDISAAVSRKRIERLHDEAVLVNHQRHSVQEGHHRALYEHSRDDVGEVYRDESDNAVHGGAAADREQSVERNAGD